MYYIKPAKGYLTSLFSNSRKNPALNGVIRPHQGIDISGDSDNTIIAAASGKVRFVETNHKRTGFGYYVVITHSNGQETLYAHLSSISVRTGQNVTRGQKIGIKGTTGNSTGIHLHFEISRGRWVNNFASKLDPLLQFKDPVTREIQTMLNRLDYGKLTEDGIYGDATISAVTRYQRNKKMRGVDGVAGRSTYAMMVADAKEVPTVVIPKPVPPKKEVDEMAEQLPKTQQNDMRTLLKHAYESKVFTENHVPKVDTMTRGQATDLLISYVGRTK